MNAASNHKVIEMLEQFMKLVPKAKDQDAENILMGLLTEKIKE